MSVDIQYGKKCMLVVKFSDGMGIIILCFFYFGVVQWFIMMLGNMVWCFGEVCIGKWGIEMMYFEFKLVDEDVLLLEELLMLVYFIIDGVKQLIFCNLIDQVLKLLDKGVLVDLLFDGIYDD